MTTVALIHTLAGSVPARVQPVTNALAPTSKTPPKSTQGLRLASILSFAWAAVCATGQGRAAHRQHAAAARARH